MKQNKLEAAIILVSEITKGMKSIGSKALLNINDNLTVIDHQIQYLKKYYNPSKIILSTGFDHDRIVEKTKKYKNISYILNNEYATENQVGSLIRCLDGLDITNALIVVNGLILFDRITLSQKSATYFINSSQDKRDVFDIGTNIINDDGYLFYDLNYKWIELLFLNKEHISMLKQLHYKNNISQLFLFELINMIKSKNCNIDFIQLDHRINNPIKINSLKDINHAKKIYKKYLSVSN